MLVGTNGDRREKRNWSINSHHIRAESVAGIEGIILSESITGVAVLTLVLLLLLFCSCRTVRQPLLGRRTVQVVLLITPADDG
jgi:hypothetical protein